MKCQYCGQQLFNSSELQGEKKYVCRHNKIVTIFYYLSDDPNYKFIHFICANYLVEISLFTNTTGLYQILPKEFITHFNEIINLTPETVEFWIERVLKLKAFY